MKSRVCSYYNLIFKRITEEQETHWRSIAPIYVVFTPRLSLIMVGFWCKCESWYWLGNGFVAFILWSCIQAYFFLLGSLQELSSSLCHRNTGKLQIWEWELSWEINMSLEKSVLALCFWNLSFQMIWKEKLSFICFSHVVNMCFVSRYFSSSYLFCCILFTDSSSGWKAESGSDAEG